MLVVVATKPAAEDGPSSNSGHGEAHNDEHAPMAACSHGNLEAINVGGKHRAPPPFRIWSLLPFATAIRLSRILITN